MLAYLSKATRASTALPLFPLTLSLGGVYDRVNFSSIAGTVKEYDHHILVRIPQSGSGWPSLIERSAPIFSLQPLFTQTHTHTHTVQYSTQFTSFIFKKGFALGAGTPRFSAYSNH
jgi:hypothetical protein